MKPGYPRWKKHGEAGGDGGVGRSVEYRLWSGMKDRCFNKNEQDYPYYGGAGITVCERWLTFEPFLADMGRRPSPKHSLDRIDGTGNYEPGNVRWATRSLQNYNRRRKRIGPLMANLQFFTRHVRHTC